MGIYADDLLFAGPPPGVLPKFAIVCFLIVDVDDYPKGDVTLRVVLPGAKDPLVQVLEQSKPRVAREGNTKRQLRFIIQMTGLSIGQAGDIELHLETDTGSLRAGRIAVKFAESAPVEHPSASEAETSSVPTADPPKRRQRRAARAKS